MSSLFVWERYKTEQCNGECNPPSDSTNQDWFSTSGVSLKFHCPHWHDKTDRRRTVGVGEKNKLSYSRLYLRDVPIDDYKHCSNYIEYLYHPQNYKSRECPSLNIRTNSNLPGQACLNGQMCPYYHTIQERNDWLNDPRSVRFRTAPKEKFTQSLLDDFNNISSSVKQLEKIYELVVKDNSMTESKISQSSQIDMNNTSSASGKGLLAENVGATEATAAASVASGSSQIKSQQQPLKENQIDLVRTIKPSEGLLEASKKKTVASPVDEVKDEQLYSSDVGRYDFLGLPKVQQESGEFSASSGNMLSGTTSASLTNNKNDIFNIVNLNNSVLQQINGNIESGIHQFLGISQQQQLITENNQVDKPGAVVQQTKLAGSSSSSLVSPAKQVCPVKQIRNNKKDKQKLKESQTQNEMPPAELELSQISSKITDLSLNDDYLQESFYKQQVKKYQYHQDLGLHESPTVEFKNYQKLSMCKIQKDMNASLRLQEYGQYICGFLNHRGGTMYIGVHDDGWVDGIYLNSKKRDWFCQYIDTITSQIEPRLVVGEIRIGFVEVLNKQMQTGYEGTPYVIELSIVKTNFSDLYFYDNQAYIKRTASLTKMSIQEIKQDLLVKLKKQQKAEANTINKLIQFEDASELENQSLEQLLLLEKNLEGALTQVKGKISKIQNSQGFSQL